MITHLGCWENTRKACKSRACVLPTSRVGYHAGKPIESVDYSLNNEPSLLPLLAGWLAQLVQRCTSIPRYLSLCFNIKSLHFKDQNSLSLLRHIRKTRLRVLSGLIPGEVAQGGAVGILWQNYKIHRAMRSLRGQRRPLCHLICASFSLNSIYEL